MSAPSLTASSNYALETLTLLQCANRKIPLAERYGSDSVIVRAFSGAASAELIMGSSFLRDMKEAEQQVYSPRMILSLKLTEMLNLAVTPNLWATVVRKIFLARYDGVELTSGQYRILLHAAKDLEYKDIRHEQPTARPHLMQYLEHELMVALKREATEARVAAAREAAIKEAAAAAKKQVVWLAVAQARASHHSRQQGREATRIGNITDRGFEPSRTFGRANSLASPHLNG